MSSSEIMFLAKHSTFISQAIFCRLILSSFAVRLDKNILPSFWIMCLAELYLAYNAATNAGSITINSSVKL